MHANGEIYDGQIKAGIMFGKGIYYYNNGSAYYDGFWLAGKKHG